LSPDPKEDEGDPKVQTATHPTAKEPGVPGGVGFLFRDRPLEFSLTSKGLAVTGGTNSASDLAAFIKKLEALAVLLPDDYTVACPRCLGTGVVDYDPEDEVEESMR
jgi:hypothetical protein